ncbi:MAG: ribonuclease T2 family protein, partial [Pseudomonadales bacterium]
ASNESVQPGQRNYLQCASGKDFGYILHGLWPQGEIGSRNYPRACLGDQPKIPAEQLEKYLCMTPSKALLQHEYEYHGTCMPTAQLRTPQGYFNKAQQLHRQLNLPQEPLQNRTSSYRWWYENNPHLVPGSVKYAAKSREWRLCYDSHFKSMACDVVEPQGKGAIKECHIKGNISRSGKKYYFTAGHRNYPKVKIDLSRGERCFDSERQARSAGWQRAPK